MQSGGGQNGGAAGKFNAMTTYGTLPRVALPGQQTHRQFLPNDVTAVGLSANLNLIRDQGPDRGSLMPMVLISESG